MQLIPNVIFVAEVKTKSPFGWEASKNWLELFKIANEFGDIISIHTDPRWGGSFDLLKKARQMTNKPILAKGIHKNDKDISKALEAGANYVLVVGRIPTKNTRYCWIEPTNLTELKTIPKDMKVVWNSRDLTTGNEKNETFAQARKLRDGWICQASNIRTISDIRPGADAVLIGTNLVEFIKSAGDKKLGKNI